MSAKAMLTGIMSASVVSTSPRRRSRLWTSDRKLSKVVTVPLSGRRRPRADVAEGRKRLAKRPFVARIVVLAWTVRAA